MKLHIVLFLSSLLFLAACDNTEKEKQLKQRELHLIEKEKEFATKEKDYQNLLVMRDSLRSIEDTTTVAKIPDIILGKWNGKMICVESECPEYVIGDQRNDIWEFSENGLKILNKNGGDRSYNTVKISDSELRMTSENNTPYSTKSEVVLFLNLTQSGRAKGTRELTGKSGCISKFSVELEKIKD